MRLYDGSSLIASWKRREIVLLAYLLGKSDTEISRELKLSRTTARDRRRDAIRRLRELLGGKA